MDIDMGGKRIPEYDKKPQILPKIKLPRHKMCVRVWVLTAHNIFGTDKRTSAYMDSVRTFMISC